MRTSQEYFTTIVYAKFGGQAECIVDNWKIVNTGPKKGARADKILGTGGCGKQEKNRNKWVVPLGVVLERRTIDEYPRDFGPWIAYSVSQVWDKTFKQATRTMILLGKWINSDLTGFTYRMKKIEAETEKT